LAHTAILWQGLYFVGHDYARIEQRNAGWQLEGVALFVYAAAPCRLDYLVECTEAWATKRARIWGWVGARPIDIQVAVSGAQQWWLNDVEVPAVQGCLDLDLNFSPATNTLAIRRLALAVGAQQPVRAAWLRFPSFQLEPLDQSYRRLDEEHYHYASAGGNFTAELVVDRTGFVRDYPGLWIAQLTKEGRLPQ
jgi:uncharacterized protein